MLSGKRVSLTAVLSSSCCSRLFGCRMILVVKSRWLLVVVRCDESMQARAIRQS